MVRFSLIIPVAPGREAEILSSIRRLDYPAADYEVVVVKGSNPSANRNLGADRARGDILVFLDDDASIPSDYLQRAEAVFAKYPAVDIVGGPQLTSKSDKPFSKISWYALSSFFGAWKVSHRYAVRKTRLNVDETAVSSANLLCRKAVLERIRFDTKLFPGEDPRFIADARKAGFKIAYSPMILLYHRRRPTMLRLVQQIFSYGKARPQKETVRETMKMPFFFVPSLFLLYLTMLGVLISLQPREPDMAPALRNGFIGLSVTGIMLFSPLMIYAISALFFAVYDAVKNRDYKAVLILPFIYPVIHLSYGLGMIWGYILKIMPDRSTGGQK